MFSEYVYDESPAAYADKIWIDDEEGLNDRTDFIRAFAEHGFSIIEYTDDLSFRVNCYEQLCGNAKIAVLRTNSAYVPYDIIKKCVYYAVSLRTLFPRLNTDALRHASNTDLDLLSAVIGRNYEKLSSEEETETFIRKTAYSRENIAAYLQHKLRELQDKAARICSYKDWFDIAKSKAALDCLAIKHGVPVDTSGLNFAFQAYALESFGSLSAKIDAQTPVLVSRVMEYVHENSERFVLIVMDGMSEFDWHILSESFADVPYEETALFAMIPSTTAISRQCLLSNKYPRQLVSPWSQSKEKAEFYECARAMGYADSQIAYERGYDAIFNAFIRCGAVIINDVDDLVHAQPQGRLGMHNDISVLSHDGRLAGLAKRLLGDGFDVYITADHGNTLCTGLGKYIGAGVDVETKSHRMIVLKDYADKESLMEKYGLVEYPKYYLPKEFDYLICDGGTSLDIKALQVMTHGGITLDEVVVPFIKIKAGNYNG